MTGFLAEGACTCGQVQFTLNRKPLFRAHCHCTICQSFNSADFADILVLRTRDVSLQHRESVAFKTHQNPPLLKRGRCKDCEGVAIEEMNIPMVPKLTIIPVQTLRQSAEMPAPRFHMFYHRRIRDVVDSVPKYSGYIGSQMHFSTTVLKTLLTSGSKLILTGPSVV